ncbi:hypothetical protein BH09MYX1_BH09MYX1_31720 [soil metagenome]
MTSQAPARSPERARFFVAEGEELWSQRIDALSDTDPLVAKCAAIEARAWRPREPFTRALRRSDHLLWAARGDEVTGFVLVSFHTVSPRHLGISIDEAMVDRDHVGKHVVSRLFWTAACGASAHATARGDARIVFFALTSSTRLISAFYKYRFLLPEHSFAPRAWLERAAAGYLSKRGLAQLTPSSNVWAKAAFPNTRVLDEPEIPHVPVPPGFDPKRRGDALLMVGAIPTAIARPIALARHAILFRNVLGRHVVLPW